MTRLTALAAAIAAATVVTSAQAVVVDPQLPGNTSANTWLALTAGNYPGFGGFPGNTTATWSEPGIVSTTGDASIMKTANGTGGGPYPASGSIYYGGFSGAANNNGGTLAVRDATPLANVKNVVLQVDIGEAWTYDFFNHVLPTLSYNGGSQALAPTVSKAIERIYTGTVTMPSGEEPVYRNTWLVQWDLSNVAAPITSIATSFTGVQHAQLYGVRLDQSDVYTVSAAVPEPAALAAFGAGAIALVGRRRRR